MASGGGGRPLAAQDKPESSAPRLPAGVTDRAQGEMEGTRPRPGPAPGGHRAISFKYQFHGGSWEEAAAMLATGCVLLAGVKFVRKGGSHQPRIRMRMPDGSLGPAESRPSPGPVLGLPIRPVPASLPSPAPSGLCACLWSLVPGPWSLVPASPPDSGLRAGPWSLPAPSSRKPARRLSQTRLHARAASFQRLAGPHPTCPQASSAPEAGEWVRDWPGPRLGWGGDGEGEAGRGQAPPRRQVPRRGAVMDGTGGPMGEDGSLEGSDPDPGPSAQPGWRSRRVPVTRAARPPGLCHHMTSTQPTAPRPEAAATAVGLGLALG